MVSGRRLAFAGVLLCAMPLMSGCIFAENIGPVQISTIDGSLAVAFCDLRTDKSPRTITSIEIVQLEPGGDRVKDWELLWEARGPFEVVDGDVVVVSDRTEGFGSSYYADDVFSSDQGYEYEVNLEFADGVSYGPVLKSPNGGLVQGSWLTTGGKEVPQPCD